MFAINACDLGSRDFKQTYGLKYAYLTGAMYKGISSTALVVKLAKAGFMGYFGTGGLSLTRIEEAINSIKHLLGSHQNYGMNLLCNLEKPEKEEETVKVFLNHRIKNIEAAAYSQITPSLVWFRLKGLKQSPEGNILAMNQVVAKVSRPEVATLFMSPPPKEITYLLVQQGKITEEEAKWSEYIPISHDICVEADSGGHTDQGVALALIPTIQRIRDHLQTQYHTHIRVGAAGGIGTPEAAAAAFILGADFIMTGSINQCTVEAGTSDAVKDLLQSLNVQDMAYAPAGDMFEMGVKVQVAKKGLLFPARANRLYELYRQHRSLETLEEKTQHQIQEKYFKRDFNEVWQETKHYYLKTNPNEILKAEQNAHHKMALIFRWYFIHTMRMALQGNEHEKMDYQIHCGPALGAFNEYVRGTELESWRHRNVDKLAEKIMIGAAEVLTSRYQCWINTRKEDPSTFIQPEHGKDLKIGESLC